MRCAGFLLAGGESSRMGRDKALLPYGGQTLAAHVAALLAEAASPVFVVGPRDRYGHLGLPVVEDAHRGAGPLSGIVASLETLSALEPETEMALVVACDMPHLRADFLKALAAHAASCAADATLAAGPSGQVEPLCAVYRRTCLPQLAAALAAGQRKVRDALTGLRVARWETPDASLFANANTPAEWRDLTFCQL